MKTELLNKLNALLPQLLDGHNADDTAANPIDVQVEVPRDAANGDFSSNLAMVLAKPLRRAPRQIAQDIVARLGEDPIFTRIDIAGPGFINFYLAAGARLGTVGDVLQAGDEFGFDRSGSKGKVMVEFVSANPTGPMHVGHGRNAAYGDALSSLLSVTGWEVSREYYINDAGRQADILAVSVWVRYLQAQGVDIPFPRRGYPADYVLETAREIARDFSQQLFFTQKEVLHELPVEPADEEDANEVRAAEIKGGQEKYIDALIVRARKLLGEQYTQLLRASIDDQMERIRETLEEFHVKFDNWASERDLVESGAAEKALSKLRERGYVYDKDGAVWLKTSELGDEKDRVLIKADGYATYFANDIAYHADKLDRGFPNLWDVWGADHHGYIPRVRAAIEALTGNKDALNVQLIQFVSLSSGKMGKRSGNFVTLGDLLKEAGSDATRFFYLMRSHDQHLEFDIELAKSKSNENPVFYVQYAHARICSVFNQLEDRGFSYDHDADHDLSTLLESHEQTLMAVMSRWPETVENAARQAAPHTVVHYLRELADAFHSYYNAHAFLVDDAPTRDARLTLIKATRQVLRNGLSLLGISAPESM